MKLTAAGMNLKGPGGMFGPAARPERWKYFGVQDKKFPGPGGHYGSETIEFPAVNVG